MEEKNQNIEESNKKDLTQEEIEDVQGGAAVKGGDIDILCSKNSGSKIPVDVS